MHKLTLLDTIINYVRKKVPERKADSKWKGSLRADSSKVCMQVRKEKEGRGEGDAGKMAGGEGLKTHHEDGIG